MYTYLLIGLGLYILKITFASMREFNEIRLDVKNPKFWRTMIEYMAAWPIILTFRKESTEE